MATTTRSTCDVPIKIFNFYQDEKLLHDQNFQNLFFEIFKIQNFDLALLNLVRGFNLTMACEVVNFGHLKILWVTDFGTRNFYP